MSTRLEWHGEPRGLIPPAQFRQDAGDLAAREHFERPMNSSRLAVVAQDVEQHAVVATDEHAPIPTRLGAAASGKFRDTRQLFIYRLDGALSLIFVTNCTSDEDSLRKAEAIAGYGYRVEVWSDGVQVQATNGNAALTDYGTKRVQP